MAESTPITPGSGTNIAIETILSTAFQRIIRVGFRGNSAPLAFDVTATSAQGIASNTNRAGITLQNLSGENVIGAFAATPSAASGAETGSFVIPAWGSWSMTDLIDTRAVNFIRLAAGTSHVIGMEWTIT